MNIRTGMSWLVQRERIGSVTLCVAIIFGILSLWLYWIDHDFGSRLSLMLSSAFLSICITFVVVHFVIDRDKVQQWKDIEKLTYKAILNDLIFLGMGLYSELPTAHWTETPNDLMETRRKNTEVWQKLKEMESFPDWANEIIRTGRDVLVEEKDGTLVRADEREAGSFACIDEEVVVRLIKNAHKNIQPYIDDIRHTQIQRILQSPANKTVKDHLIEFDVDIIAEYEFNIQRFFDERQGGLTHSSFAIKSMIKLGEKASELHKEINELV